MRVWSESLERKMLGLSVGVAQNTGSFCIWGCPTREL
jgi:hypothetical protein